MPPDFTQRAEPSTLPEWMDEPCSYEEFRACLRDLRQVNRLSRGYRPTLAWLSSLLEAYPTPHPLRILDVGCGGGDLLREIAGWAANRRVEVSLTGIDLNPHAARAAEDFASPGETITFLTADAFLYRPAAPADVIVSSLFTHHLETPDVVRFVAWMESQARLGWFINDLGRSRQAFYGFQALAAVMRWHRFVRHDGPVSFRRAFLAEDWRRIAQAAGLAPESIDLQSWSPGRLCVARQKSIAHQQSAANQQHAAPPSDSAAKAPEPHPQ